MNSARLRYFVSVYYLMRTDITSLSIVIHDHPLIHSHPRIVIETCFFCSHLQEKHPVWSAGFSLQGWVETSGHQGLEQSQGGHSTWKFDTLEKDICIGKPSFSGAMLVSGRVFHKMESKMFHGASLWILSPRVVSPQGGWCRNMEGLWPWWRNRISIPTGKAHSKNQA